ncbi:MAG: hypothetical protein M1820_006426 [Bogoriella megaspora]|nr:MAG: hypothetical protein M1820_006426 [Bogoriella megaspora]
MAPADRNPAMAQKIESLRLTLAPIVPLPTGPSHPEFPKTLLNFWLLTEGQLDSLAHYYHQSTPCVWTNQYPANMNWDVSFFNRTANSGQMSEKQRIAIKRRKFGKFIGMNGCETPVEEVEFRLQVLEAELAQSLRRAEHAMMPHRKFA